MVDTILGMFLFVKSVTRRHWHTNKVTDTPPPVCCRLWRKLSPLKAINEWQNLSAGSWGRCVADPELSATPGNRRVSGWGAFDAAIVELAKVCNELRRPPSEAVPEFCRHLRNEPARNMGEAASC